MKDEKNVVGERIKLLRTEKGLTQKELAYNLSIFTGRKRSISIPAVSSWELGNKVPHYKTLTALASYFGVSIDFITGKTDIRIEGGVERRYFDLSNYTVEITPINLKEYDGKPVYLVFKNKVTSNCWGIYNAEKNVFCCRDKMYRNNGGIRFFAVENNMIFSAGMNESCLELEDISKRNYFWVEYFGSDEFINSMYTGWYKHTEKKDAIINSVGNILPYDGININYRIYARGK